MWRAAGTGRPGAESLPESHHWRATTKGHSRGGGRARSVLVGSYGVHGFGAQTEHGDAEVGGLASPARACLATRDCPHTAPAAQEPEFEASDLMAPSCPKQLRPQVLLKLKGTPNPPGTDLRPDTPALGEFTQEVKSHHWASLPWASILGITRVSMSTRK